MKTRPFYLVFERRHGDAIVAVRVTQRWPSLDSGEFARRLSVEIPDEQVPGYAMPYQVTLDDPTASVMHVEEHPADPPFDDDDEHEDDDDVAA